MTSREQYTKAREAIAAFAQESAAEQEEEGRNEPQAPAERKQSGY
jgi:hypothetical protein